MLISIFRDEWEHFRYPRTIDDAKRLGRILLRYKERHFYTVLSGISAIYLVLVLFLKIKVNIVKKEFLNSSITQGNGELPPIPALNY